ncbi:MAG: hypothetical protein R3C68_14920 [Myxococcota bacterium]
MGSPAGFSVPPPRPASSGFSPLIAVLLLLVVALIGGVGVLIWFFVVRSPAIPPQAGAAPIAQAPVPVEPPGGQANVPPTPKPQDSKAVEKSASATANEDGDDDKDSKDTQGKRSGKRSSKKTASKSKASSESSGRSGGGKASGGKNKDNLDDLFAGGGSKAKEKLKIEDIVAGVKSNAGTVMPCLKTARSKGEIVPGTYKLILDWQIKPNGGVTAAVVKGPANILETSLPKCFASAMRRWKFPASSDGAPVKNFPFGPFTVK